MMWLFGKKKKKPEVAKAEPKPERLENGELPWGWISRNKDFIEQIEREYTYFLHTWLDARKLSIKEYHSALKSFVIYLEDVERLCKSKGECFEFWFTEILTSPGYLEQRRKELQALETGMDGKAVRYETRRTNAN